MSNARCKDGVDGQQLGIRALFGRIGRLRARDFFLPIVLLSTTANAAEIGGVQFPETRRVEGRELLLNGVGLRTATFFELKVYAAALYVEQPSAKAAELISSSGPKFLELRFLRNVDADKLREAWRDGFAANVSNAERLSAEIDALCAAMEDMKEGDSLSFMWSSTEAVGVQVSKNARQTVQIKGREFADALLSLWLGPKPPNPALKKGLLGEVS